MQNFSIFGRPQRLHDGLRESNYTPKDADLYALSLDLFGFPLSAFPIWPFCDLLTKLIELRAMSTILYYPSFFSVSEMIRDKKMN